MITLRKVRMTLLIQYEYWVLNTFELAIINPLEIYQRIDLLPNPKIGVFDDRLVQEIYFVCIFFKNPFISFHWFVLFVLCFLFSVLN